MPLSSSLHRKTNHKKVTPLKTNGHGPHARTRHLIIFETFYRRSITHQPKEEKKIA